MDFKVGDQVLLKSGGPTMTIEKIMGTRISCTWFNGKNELSRDVFEAEALDKHPGAQGF
jgi:uncharacterized protein YodC (DUF2158 family)